MLIGTLPAGLTHPAGDSIGADLPDLAPGETKTFKMPVTAAQPGTHTVEIRVKTKDSEIVTRPQVEVVAPAPGSTSNAAPPTIQQTSASGLQLQIQSRDDQVGLGRETIAVVSLANTGVAPASNVQLTLFLSDGLEATTNAQAPVPYRINGKRIFFDRSAGMQADGKLLFHVGVRAVGVGEQNIRVQVTSDQERTPVARSALSVRVMSCSSPPERGEGAHGKPDCNRSGVCYNGPFDRDAEAKNEVREPALDSFTGVKSRRSEKSFASRRWGSLCFLHPVPKSGNESRSHGG